MSLPPLDLHDLPVTVLASSDVPPGVAICEEATQDCTALPRETAGESSREATDEALHQKTLDTARDLLDGAVCECGHLESDHVFETEDGPAVIACDLTDDCPCRTFQPVLFIVERVR